MNIQEVRDAVSFVGGTIVDESDVGIVWADTHSHHYISDISELFPRRVSSPTVGNHPCCGYDSYMTITEIVVAQSGK